MSEEGALRTVAFPRLGAGLYVRYLADGRVQVARWDRAEDREAAMRAAGIDE